MTSLQTLKIKQIIAYLPLLNSCHCLKSETDVQNGSQILDILFWNKKAILNNMNIL